MIVTLHDRQRQAIRDFKQAVAHRSNRELDVDIRFRDGTLDNERNEQTAQSRIESAFRGDRAALDKQIDETRTRMLAHYDQEHGRLEQELADKKRAAIATYVETRQTSEAEFKDARWTILTMHEADRKLARNHFVDAQRKSKDALKTLSENIRAGRETLVRWRLELGAPRPADATVGVDAEDPPSGLDARVAYSATSLAQLRSLGLPNFIKGMLPWLVLALVWIVAALPAFLLEWWYYWLLGATLLVLPIGYGVVRWLRREARRLAWDIYARILQALVDGRALRKRWLKDARDDYRLQRRLSRERNQRALRKTAQKTKSSILATRKARQRALAGLLETYPPLLEQVKFKRERDRIILEEKAKAGIGDLEDRRNQDLEDALNASKKRKVDLNHQHAREWTDLAAAWKEACEHFRDEMEKIEAAANAHFPPWDEVADPLRPLPATLPLGIKYGDYSIKVEEIADAVPEDPHLARVHLDGVAVPALLPFPLKSSVLFHAKDEGKAAAVAAMEALLLRCWTALPPGKMRCTIIDPVGRGENFSAFMHLADHDESLVSARIWTEPHHIEQRLSDITLHMETVLQKYLRNQFETLADYNEQAGEVAEPFRFLVVAHFPVNFSTDAARRLISIASAGARCGVYTFILADLRQPLPHGVNLEDLENVCFNFLWRAPRFLWPDEDFGVFPLTMETAPPAEAATKILNRVGAAAQRALRVEVPFSRLLPPRDEWWREKSRSTLEVPLGRAGATGLQWLCLGEGTSQHVLIAGKTGSGKSTLLHVLILQLALRYSPDEVELYLVDFKKGVEFKTYAANRLPHARVVAVESEREFGLSVLQKLDAELSRRGDLFRAAGVTDVAGYRRIGKAEERSQNSEVRSQKSEGKRKEASSPNADHDDTVPSAPNLPRLFLIVDEFQEFFVEDDKVAQEAALLLDRLVRQGRAFGIHILLGSQTLGGAYSLARSTIDQMAIRIALQCSETDAHLILGKDNTEARLLSRPGEAIYNAAGGALEGNHLFQAAWLADAERDHLISEIRQVDNQRRAEPIVFEGNVPADLSRNDLLKPWLDDHQTAGAFVSAWLGEAVAIKDPTAAVFRNQSGANLLVLGQQDRSAAHLIFSLLVSLCAQLRNTPEREKSLHLVLGQSVDEDVAQECRILGEHWPIQIAGVRELSAILNDLVADCDRRLKGEAGAPCFLVLFGLHRLRDLRRDESDFGFSSKPDQPLTPQKQFLQLVREGPAVGIHTVVWCDNLANLQRSIDRPDLREFEMRVCFQMSATDSSTLLDNPAASKLGPYRALFFAEDQGKLEKFRPYGLPPKEWLQEIIAREKASVES